MLSLFAAKRCVHSTSAIGWQDALCLENAEPQLYCREYQPHARNPAQQLKKGHCTKLSIVLIMPSKRTHIRTAASRQKPAHGDRRAARSCASQ